MGKSSKVIQSSSCVTKQTYVFSCLFIFFSLVRFVFLFEGSSSNTHVLAQHVAWPNAGSVLSCSATTLQRTQQTCWWRRFSCSPLPLLLPGSHHFCFFFFLFFLCRKHVFLCLLWVMWVNFSIFLSSPQVAFLRFLHLLSSFDWRNNPLIVNLNNQLTGKCSLTHIPFPCVWHKQIPLDLFLFTRPTYFYIRPYALLFQRQIFFASLSRVAVDYPEIKNGFMATRESLPVMFIATPKDKKLSMWTKRSPSIQVSGHTSTQITKYLIDQLSALNFKWLNITFV